MMSFSSFVKPLTARFSKTVTGTPRKPYFSTSFWYSGFSEIFLVSKGIPSCESTCLTIVHSMQSLVVYTNTRLYIFQFLRISITILQLLLKSINFRQERGGKCLFLRFPKE